MSLYCEDFPLCRHFGSRPFRFGHDFVACEANEFVRSVFVLCLPSCVCCSSFSSAFSSFVPCVLTVAWSRWIRSQLRLQTWFPVAHHWCYLTWTVPTKLRPTASRALLQPNKRSGAVMDAEDAPAAAVCSPTECDLGASSLNDGMDVENTLAAVFENCSKRRKEDEFTKELMKGAAPKAVQNGYAVASIPA